MQSPTAAPGSSVHTGRSKGAMPPKRPRRVPFASGKLAASPAQSVVICWWQLSRSYALPAARGRLDWGFGSYLDGRVESEMQRGVGGVCEGQRGSLGGWIEGGYVIARRLTTPGKPAPPASPTHASPARAAHSTCRRESNETRRPRRVFKSSLPKALCPPKGPFADAWHRLQPTVAPDMLPTRPIMYRRSKSRVESSRHCD